MAYSSPIKEIGEVVVHRPEPVVHQISDTVCRVTENKAPRGWWIAFLVAATFTCVARGGGRLTLLGRSRRLGQRGAELLGMGHHELRVVDWHRSCGDIDQRRPLHLSPEVAHERSIASRRR